MRVGIFDELALGLGVSLAVLSEVRGENSLQRGVIGCELPISSETVPKTQAPVHVLALIHEVQMVRATGRRRITQEATIYQVYVESCG